MNKWASLPIAKWTWPINKHFKEIWFVVINVQSMELLSAKWISFMFVWQFTSVWAEGHGTVVHWWLILIHACTLMKMIEWEELIHFLVCTKTLTDSACSFEMNEAIILNMDRHLACMYCYIDWPGVFNRVERSLALLHFSACICKSDSCIYIL